MLFSNMCSEILCLFLLESNEEILERPKKLVWTKNFSVHFRIFSIGIRNQKLELLLIYQLVEQNLPYKMDYLSFFLSSDKIPKFSFFYHPHF